MSNFKSYNEAVEFVKANHPIQTREVLFEKTKFTLQEKFDEYFNKIFHSAFPDISEEESFKLKKERERKIKKLVHHYSFEPFNSGPSFDFVLEEFYKKQSTRKDDIKSMWLEICELF